MIRINAQIKDLNNYIALTWLITAFVSFGCTTPISAGTVAAEMAGASGGAQVSPFAGQTTAGQRLRVRRQGSDNCGSDNCRSDDRGRDVRRRFRSCGRRRDSDV